MPRIKLSAIELDALKEIANTGASKASITLSNLINKKVNLVVSDVNIVNSNSLHRLFKGPQKIVIGIYTPFRKGMTGNVLMMLPKNDAIKLARQIQKIKYNPNEDIITKKDAKSLKKTGNIISKHYIKSLNQSLGFNINQEETEIVATFGESVVDIAMLNVHINTPQVLMITINLTIKEKKIKGQFSIIIALRSVNTLLAKLKRIIG